MGNSNAKQMDALEDDIVQALFELKTVVRKFDDKVKPLNTVERKEKLQATMELLLQKYDEDPQYKDPEERLMIVLDMYICLLRNAKKYADQVTWMANDFTKDQTEQISEMFEKILEMVYAQNPKEAGMEIYDILMDMEIKSFVPDNGNEDDDGAIDFVINHQDNKKEITEQFDGEKLRKLLTAINGEILTMVNEIKIMKYESDNYINAKDIKVTIDNEEDNNLPVTITVWEGVKGREKVKDKIIYRYNEDCQSVNYEDADYVEGGCYIRQTHVPSVLVALGEVHVGSDVLYQGADGSKYLIRDVANREDRRRLISAEYGYLIKLFVLFGGIFMYLLKRAKRIKSCNRRKFDKFGKVITSRDKNRSAKEAVN